MHTKHLLEQQFFSAANQRMYVYVCLCACATQHNGHVALLTAGIPMEAVWT